MIRAFCHFLFKFNNWRYIENIPQEIRSFVMIGAPHTSNWDFVPAMTASYRMGRNAKFVIKNKMSGLPVANLLKSIGAIGVDRDAIKKGKVSNSTDLMADLFKQYQDLVLMIAPEGTRSANDTWKSGFWHIAQKAGVPLVLGYADYAKMEAGLGKMIIPTDFEKDMREICAFYSKVTPKFPQNFLLDKRFI